VKEADKRSGEWRHPKLPISDSVVGNYSHRALRPALARGRGNHPSALDNAKFVKLIGAEPHTRSMQQ
jgi:hypothetical protein